MAKLRDMLKLMDVKQDFYIVLGNDEQYYASRYDFLARIKSEELLDKEFIIATSLTDGTYRIELID